MQITVPIFVEKRRGAIGTRQRHTVRPLFFPMPVRADENLSRAMSKLMQDLTKELNRLGKEPRQEELARYSFSPELATQNLEVLVELKRQTVRGRLFCVTFRALGRKIAFFPKLPELWFEFRRGEALGHRAAHVLTRHFRGLEKEQGPDFEFPAHVLLDGTAWVAPLEIDVHVAQKVEAPVPSLMALLGGAEKVEGAIELQRVGRCLNWLYPAELDRVLHRDRETAELDRLLLVDDKRPVLIVGPRLVGKTAIIHEHVFRATARRRTAYSNTENVWLLSPQRLVSGMSYVGQWENRLLAILKTAAKRKHALYFDDFLGLYQAGISRDSSLNMAQVLRPYVERRSCRFLVEMTPEALRVFREKDRGLADQFHVLHVAEPSDAENLRILMSVIRRLEQQHACRFDLDALPTVLDLERRYVRDGAFPGKAARFLQQLAAQSPKAAISRERVLSEFKARSGLSLEFADPRQKLRRDSILAAMQTRMIGQREALGAVADALSIAKARLNDPGRPLASFLFLGPTGVGKTQCAKSAAAYLFGDESRLVRFDMNEFVAPGSAARLMGTFDQPEGQLTSAVRRQPFAVVLLDEIEKASPDVLDLLLQVLGEGRLSDALGRTVDFANAIVILTSNLGVREAAGRVGFGAEGRPDPRAYVKAAERFFRPELFNRLDRIVPFQALTREEIGRIARLVIQDVLAREGLARRKCYLRIDEQTLERVADAAFSPKYGARALKRGIERQLVQPVAAKLAALKPEALTVLDLAARDGRLMVELHALVDADPVPDSAALLDVRDSEAVYNRLRAAVERFASETAAWRPAGPFAASDIEPQHYKYFLVRELIGRFRETAERFEDRRRGRRRAQFVGAPPALPRQVPACSSRDEIRPSRVLREVASAFDVHEYIRELHDRSSARHDSEDRQLAELLGQAALLEAVVRCSTPGGSETALVMIESPDPAGWRFAVALQTLYGAVLGEPLGLESGCISEPISGGARGVIVRGPHALALAGVETGTHLFISGHQHFMPLRVEVHACTDEAEPAQAVGRSMSSAAETCWRPVVRMYEESGNVVDLRTGLIAPAPLSSERLREFVLNTLPLPSEVWPSTS